MSNHKNPFLNRAKGDSKTGPAYKRSRKQEKESAARIGGRQISGSGRGWRKADTEVPNLVRVECKTTVADSFRVTRGLMRKVEEAGILEGQLPVLDIEFIDKRQTVLDAYCVVRRTDLYDLIERLANVAKENDTAGGRGKRDTKPIGRRKV